MSNATNSNSNTNDGDTTAPGQAQKSTIVAAIALMAPVIHNLGTTETMIINIWNQCVLIL